mgnify:CR=1 FL=1
MTKTEKAAEIFNQGFNCAQSVLYTFADDLGINKEFALKVASGFGAGMGRMQKTCGAVTGAVMVIGFFYGSSKSNDHFSKERTYEAVQKFIKDFEKLHNTSDCIDLLGADMKTPEGKEKIQKEDLIQTRCAKYVQDTVGLLEEKYF